MKLTKNLLLLVLSCMSLVLIAPGACAADTLAHVNSDALVSLLPEYEEAKKALEAFEQEIRSQLEKMRKDFDEKSAQYTAREKQWTDSERTRRIGELQELQSRMEQFSATAEQSYQLKQNELLRPVAARAQKIIGEVAKENSITYVFDVSQGNVVYYDDARDLMPLIKKKLGRR